MAQHVDDREGIDQPSGIDGNGPPAAHERPASLELLHRQVHALPPERHEGAFDTVAPDQALEVSGLAPRVGQERPVRAGRIAVHEIAAETEEVGLAIRQARAHRSAGLGAGDATPEKAGQAGKEAGGYAEVFEKIGSRHLGGYSARKGSALQPAAAARGRVDGA